MTTVSVDPNDVLMSKQALERALYIDCRNDLQKKLEWLKPIVARMNKGDMGDMDLADQQALRDVVKQLNGKSPRPEGEGASTQRISKSIFSFPNPSHRANANKEAK